MRPLLCLLLAGCAVPTEPRVVQRQALQTMAPLDTTPLPRKFDRQILPCESYEVWTELTVDGVRYWEILTIMVCP